VEVCNYVLKEKKGENGRGKKRLVDAKQLVQLIDLPLDKKKKRRRKKILYYHPFKCATFGGEGGKNRP